MFEELTKNGKTFSMETIEDEIEALPPISEEEIKEMLDACQKFANTTNCEMNVNSTTISDLTPLLRHNIAGIHALLGIDYHLVDLVYTRPDDNALYRLFSNKLLPKEALDLEKKTGFTLPELKKKAQAFKETVEEFEDLYEQILEIDTRDETLKGRGIKQEDSSSFAALANSFIFNPFGLFNKKNTEKTDKKTEEVESSSILNPFSFFKAKTKSDNEKEEADSSWWNVKLDFGKWLLNNSEEKQISLEINTTDEDDSEESPTKAPKETTFGDKLVIDEIHEGYQTVTEYAVESAKSQCFTSAIIEMKKVNTQCIIKRNQATYKHTTSNQKDSSTEELPNQDQTALVITNSEKSLATTNDNVKSIKDTVDECHDLDTQVKNLVDNCHYMFSMETSIDSLITDSMKNASLVTAEIHNGDILLQSNGIEITFHTMGEPAESSAVEFIANTNDCTGECLLSGDDSHTMLRIDNGE